MFRIWKPKISVVVLVDRMQHAAPRALYSLSSSYQRGVRPRDYEVIVVENLSPQMLCPEQIRGFGQNFRYAVHPGDANSRAAALNFGVSLARGKHVTMMVDGASILSPGVLRRSIAATRLVERPVVATLAWHLSPDLQSQSLHNDCHPGEEDRLLESVDWRDDGYRLFEIASPTRSCRDDWLGPVLTSNCITIPRQHFHELGGFEPASPWPDDSLASADFFRRVTVDPTRRTILILGEGTFHPFHSDVATNRGNDERFPPRPEENSRLGSEALSAATPQPILFGHMPAAARRFLEPALIAASNAERARVDSALSSPPMAAPGTHASPEPQPNAPLGKVA